MEEGVVPLQRDIEVLTVRSHAEAEGPRELLLIAKPFDSRRLAHLVVLQRAKQLGFGGLRRDTADRERGRRNQKRQSATSRHCITTARVIFSEPRALHS